MSTTTRRAHKKSRHGCQQCKKNRTKCDEKRPSCGRCMRVGTKCSLIDPSTALIIIHKTSTESRDGPWQTTPLSPPSSKAGSVTSPSEVNTDLHEVRVEHPGHQLQFTNVERDRLRLMTYYNQYTAQSIGGLTLGTKEGQSIWQIAVPELAFQNDYLLHCLLSISALHIALRDPCQQHESAILAVEHHSHALALFSPHLQNITAQNVDAMFAFACLTALYSFGIHLGGRLQVSRLVKIHEIFTMIRGSSLIVKNGYPWLLNGIWGPWFSPELEKEPQRFTPELEDVFSQLTTRIDSTITTSSQRELYEGAIEALKKNFSTALVLPRTHKSVVHFPVFTPPGFSEMICLAEPLALSILATWAVILHWLRGHIWVQDWGMQTIKAVHDVLPPEWHSCIAWALTQVEALHDSL